jgi:hypothetical protein
MPTDPDSQPWRYSRASDPDTSRRSAAEVSTKITAKHLAAMQVLLDLECATADMVAEELVERGVVTRHEQGRRLVRTISEGHDYARIATKSDGTPIELVNVSGMAAQAYELTMHGVQLVLDPKSRVLK